MGPPRTEPLPPTPPAAAREPSRPSAALIDAFERAAQALAGGDAGGRDATEGATSDRRVDRRSGPAAFERHALDVRGRRPDEAAPEKEVGTLPDTDAPVDSPVWPSMPGSDDPGAPADMPLMTEQPSTAAQLTAAALLAAPLHAPPGPAAATTASATDARASLLQLSAYVERLLVEAVPRAGQTPAAEITLSADLFVDTALSIARRDGGWLLRVRSADGRLLDHMEACESALRERFARRGLGDLAVEWIA